MDEFEVMVKLYELLKPLPEETQHRVISWANSKIQSDGNAVRMNGLGSLMPAYSDRDWLKSLEQIKASLDVLVERGNDK